MEIESVILSVYFVSIFILFFFAGHSFVLVYLYRKHKENKPPWDEKYQKDLPWVTVQLPIFNEYYVARRIIDAVCLLDYPRDRLEIQILDDSTDQTLQKTREAVQYYQNQGFYISHLHRDDRVGYKSGALREGLKRAKGEFIAIFDADFIPDAQFIKRTLPYFVDDSIGFVQTRWGHLNGNYSGVTRAQAMGLDGHLMIEQTARNRAGFFINFNGTAGIWRKESIIDAGNWQDNTLTEDFDLSFRAQLKGWKAVFLNDVVSPAELPSEINALRSQQFRWTKGAIETARKLLKEVWKTPLPLKVKIESTIHLLNNVVFIFMLLVSLLNLPVLFIKTLGMEYDIYFAILGVFGVTFSGPFLFYLYSQKELYPNWKERIMLFPLFMSGSMGLALNNTKAILEGFFRRKSGFVRTPKYHIVERKDDWKDKKYRMKIPWITWGELILSVYCFVGVFFALYCQEFAALPFHFMFFFGYGSIAMLSIKHHMMR